MLDDDTLAVDDTDDDFDFEDHEDDTLEDGAALPDDGETDPDEDEFLDDEAEPTDEDGEAEGDQEEAEPEAQQFELDNGDTVTLDELTDGYLRQADYTRKTTEIAREREAVAEERTVHAERANFTEQVLQGLIGFAERLVPPQPDMELMHTDPMAYQTQLLLRQQAEQEVRNLFQVQNIIGQHSQEGHNGDLERMRAVESDKLLAAMPHLSDPARRTAFDDANRKTALEFGFTEEEIGQAMDHRILRLVHYARLGKKAESNRNNAQRRIAAPKRRKSAKSSTNGRMTGAQKAARQYRKTGDLRAAEALVDAALEED